MPLKDPKVIVLGLILLLGGFFGGMEYKAYQLRGALEQVARDLTDSAGKVAGDATNSNSNSNSEPTNLADALKNPSYQTVEHKIGEEVTLATMKLKVNGATETQTLEGGISAPVAAKDGTKFVVVDATITNTGKTNFTFVPEDGFRIVDQQGREFTSYSDTIGHIKNYLDVRDLAPSIPQSGYIVYEVPNDATGYFLAVGKGGTNEIHKIVLK